MKVLAMMYHGVTLLDLVGPVHLTLAAARAAMQQTMTGAPA